MKGLVDGIKIGDLSREEKLNLLTRLFEEFAREEKKEISSVPVSIFNKKLGSLESIVKYMKEELKLSNKKISEMINRDNRTIWAIYDKARKKNRSRLDTSSKMNIPLGILKSRKLSVLESLVRYLKEEKGLTYHEIAVCLQRDDRTIWTVYQRAKHKAS